VRPNLFDRRTSATAAEVDTVDAVEAEVVSTTEEEDEEEVTTTEEVAEVEVGTMVVVVVVTTVIKGATEASRATLLRPCQTHGRHHQAARFPRLPQAGCHLRNLEATKATKAMEVLPAHHPRNVQPGWAMHSNNTVDHRQDKQATTARSEISSTTALRTRS
jgi:hypothetical protein